MEYILLILIGVAVWRVTRFLWTEKGPLEIFEKGRAWLASRQKRAGGLYDLVSCFYCLSVWVGALFALFISPNIGVFLLNTFILSGISVIIQEILYKHK